MLQIIMLVSLLLTAAVSSIPTLDSATRLQWEAWKSTHGKTYLHSSEELQRCEVWLANKKMIETHNANVGGSSYTLAMNEFGDLTVNEWAQKFLGGIVPANFTDLGSKVTTFHTNVKDFPSSLDWRSKNIIPPVKDQGQCNSSYAFSAIAALEGASAMVSGKAIPFSEQNVLDCTVPYGNHGCNGGSAYNTYKYIISQGGVDKAINYPYKGKQGPCYSDLPSPDTDISGVVRIPSGSESDLLAAVATVGPVAVNVDASPNTFRFYSSGVFDTVLCSSTSLNHAMVIIGYGSLNEKKYWIVKNSWGKSWGEGGYILMARDSYNQCGIATEAVYPTL